MFRKQPQRIFDLRRPPTIEDRADLNLRLSRMPPQQRVPTGQQNFLKRCVPASRNRLNPCRKRGRNLALINERLEAQFNLRPSLACELWQGPAERFQVFPVLSPNTRCFRLNQVILPFGEIGVLQNITFWFPAANRRGVTAAEFNDQISQSDGIGANGGEAHDDYVVIFSAFY